MYAIPQSRGASVAMINRKDERALPCKKPHVTKNAWFRNNAVNEYGSRDIATETNDKVSFMNG